MNYDIGLKQSGSRNVGVDLLRIIAMLMIVILHCLGHGGILHNTPEFSIQNHAAWFLEIACFGGVNIFALITGYVSIDTTHRWGRIIALWLNVFVYSVGFTGIFYFMPESTISIGHIIKSCFPVMINQYWYFTCYFCVFLFMPYLRIWVNHLSKRQHKALIYTGILIFCIFSVIGLWLDGDIFVLKFGYSPIWLMAVFITGAYIKRYPEDFQRYHKGIYILLYFLCIGLAWASKILIAQVTSRLFGGVQYDTLFISYTSPFIFISSVCLLVFFSQLHIQRFKKCIIEVSSVAFGVYLISEHPLVRAKFITDRFIPYTNLPWYLMLLYCLLTSIVIYSICSVLDYIRKKVFSAMHIPPLCEKLAQRLKSFLTPDI